VKEIKAFVRVEYINSIIHVLKAAGIPHMSVTHVQAIGNSIDKSETRVSMELGSSYENMAKLEIVCPENQAEEIVSIIQREAHTGRPGDGIIYVSSVDMTIRIRTGERDHEALTHEH
jgi:nitrogen regulatory protein P-II 1